MKSTGTGSSVPEQGRALTAAENERLTSLVLLSTSVAEHNEALGANLPEVCPRVNFHLFSKGTLRVVPGTCQAYGCAVCGPRKAAMWPAVIGELAPVRRMLTVTALPESGTREWCKMLAHRIRKRYGGHEWAWTIERNPKGTGLHLHAPQHGPAFLPQRELQQMAGGRRVWIEEIKGSAERYAMKETLAAVYAQKGSLERYAEALELNAGRPVHFSRAFFGSRTATAARKAWVQSRPDYDAGPWLIVPGQIEKASK